MVVFGAAGVMKVFADAGVERGIERDIGPWRAELGDGATGAGGEPRREIGERKTGELRAAFPNAFGFGHGWDERKPCAVAGIVRDDAVGAFEFGEIKIFSVALERIGLVAGFGERDRAASADDEQGIIQRQAGGDALAARGKEIAHEVRRWYFGGSAARLGRV